MKQSLFATILLSSLLISSPAVAAEDTFGIGSAAPVLDIAHWVSPSDIAGKPVTKFEDGQIYIVEFWATWCGPCIASMPHLAEIQEKYRDKNVRIISVSDEPLKTVESFLKQEGPGGKTFGDITSVYSLTTDPDRSVYEAYMDAAGQNGIPTAFIVGKDGFIEWIGHPTSMDDPTDGDALKNIVAGKWDRQAFKLRFDEQNIIPRLIAKISELAQADKMADAVKVAQEELAKAKSPEIKAQLEELVQSLKLNAGMVDDEVREYFRGELESIKGDPITLGRFSYMIHSAMQSGADVGDLASATIKALDESIEDAPEEYKVFLYNQLAQLQEATGNIDKAIEAQQQAVKSSEGQAKKRMQLYLEELKSNSEASDQPSKSEKPAEAKAEKATDAK